MTKKTLSIISLIAILLGTIFVTAWKFIPANHTSQEIECLDSIEVEFVLDTIVNDTVFCDTVRGV